MDSRDRRLDRFSENLGKAVQAVRETSESIAADAQEQTTLMVALSESAGILAKQSQETAQRLVHAQTEARSASKDLGNSFEVVEALFTSVQQLAELSAATADAMDDFGRLMREIGRMTEFVEEVSDETQLLALNAAIEAARAGQHGLGFAVVAGEVGRLAKTTSESTSEIKRLVVDVQREAEETIAAVRTNATRSAESAPLADSARASLAEIAELAADLSVAIDQAVAAGHEHSNAAVKMRRETDVLATAAAEQGREALESAFATQRLAYYGAEIDYLSRRRITTQREQTVLRAATLLPRGYPPVRAWEYIAARLPEATQGRVSLELEAPFTGGSEFEELLRVRSGELDMVSVTTFVSGALLPLAQVLDLPFVFRDRDEAHRLLDGPLGEHILESFAPFGLVGMAFFENGMRHFTNSVRPIRTPEDCRKMRIRIQDSVVYLALMHALGASPRVIGFERLRQALLDGDVDAQENPLANIVGARLDEAQKYLTLTAHTYNTQIVLANNERLSGLPENDRDTLAGLFAEATEMHRSIAAQEEAQALEHLRKRLDVHELSDDEHEAFVNASRFVWERMEPLFPEEIYALLVSRNLQSWRPDRTFDRTHARSFSFEDVVRAIDESVTRVRTTVDLIGTQSNAQSMQLRNLAGESTRLNVSNAGFADQFASVRRRFDDVLPQVETMRGTVSHLIATIEQLSTMALQSRDALDQFAKSMKQIVEIIALVRSVSDKTNLLALNAAIEAARAGDHGKGFNVVAGEVRGLADKTKASTVEIRTVLADLGDRGKTAAVAIGTGVAKAEMSSRQAHAAVEAFGRIDAFARSSQAALDEAESAANDEAQRAHAMSGDYAQMSTLVETRAVESRRAVGVTVELDRERRALLA